MMTILLFFLPLLGGIVLVDYKAKRSTRWLRRIGLYLVSLAILALFGWEESTIMTLTIVGGIVLIGWWIAGLGWVAVTDIRELEKIAPEIGSNSGSADSIYYDPAYSSLSCNVWHHNDD